MSEISELISLLDERGVEWSNAPTWILRWRDSKNREAKAVGFSNGLLCSTYLTPEQAVEATLGRWTCKVVSSIRHDYEGGYGGTEYEHELSCGHKTWWTDDDPPEWCPHCGRKVVDA